MSSEKNSSMKSKIRSKIRSFPKWDTQTTLKFLKLYQKHECLWNKKNRLYPDRAIRMDCLRDIRDNMKLPGFDISLVIAKINIVRTMYAKECKKIQLHSQTGEEYNTQLEWFEFADSFLKDIVQLRGSIVGNKRRNVQSSNSYHKKRRLNIIDDNKSEDENKESGTTDDDYNGYDNKSETSFIEIRNEALIDWTTDTSNIITKEKACTNPNIKDNFKNKHEKTLVKKKLKKKDKWSNDNDISMVEIKSESTTGWPLTTLSKKSRINCMEQNSLNPQFNMECDPRLLEQNMRTEDNSTDYDDDSNLLCVTPQPHSNGSVYSKQYNKTGSEHDSIHNNIQNGDNYNNFNIDDEFDIFGKSVSNQLKTLPLDKAYELEFKIQHLLTNAKLLAMGRNPVHL